jgi:hypothetical protein
LFVFQYWGLNSGPTPWATPPALYCDEYFQDRVSWTICPSCLWTVVLLISASWVARITGVSHPAPARAVLMSVKTCSQSPRWNSYGERDLSILKQIRAS